MGRAWEERKWGWKDRYSDAAKEREGWKRWGSVKVDGRMEWGWKERGNWTKG